MLTTRRTLAVTGAFGFTGRAIAHALVARGDEVVTLTRRMPRSDPLAPRIKAAPLDFTRPADLAGALAGVDTLINTYWVRFPRGAVTFERAVAESAVLFAAAREAGVRRIVHVSVIRANPDGPTEYVRAKGILEGIVTTSGLEWSIVRPTLSFGRDDILINNLAWALRRLPVYGIPGQGRYRVQPVHVEDIARICLELADGLPGRTVDAAGPETLEFREMVEIVRRSVGSRSVVVPMPSWAVLAAGNVLGLLVGDVVLKRDEIRELTTSFLTSDQVPLGTVRFSEWVPAHAAELGRSWSSELKRNYRRGLA